MKTTLLLLFLLFTHETLLLAQESCQEKLLKASNYYESGNLTAAINIANSCAVDTKLTSERWQAYRLQAMAYLANGQGAEARKAAEEMLTLNPNYTPSVLKDPSDLIRLLQSIKVIPKLSIGLALTIGGNIPFQTVTTTYDVTEAIKKYSKENSFQFGIHAGYNINSYLSLNMGLLASSNKMIMEYVTFNSSIKVEETFNYLSVPLTSRVTFLNTKRFRPFGEVGLFAAYLLNSSNNFYKLDTLQETQSKVVRLESTQRRNRWNYGPVLGVGFLYRINNVYLSLDARYFMGLPNITKEETRFDFASLYNTYYYTDDDFTLSNLTISIGVRYGLTYRVVKQK
jgi:hypothetical protein